MAFQISPGVNVSEIDLTTVIPSVLTTAGAFVGNFTWGPAKKIILVDTELTLVNKFAPTGPVANSSNSSVYNSSVSFFTAANFLSYGNNLQIVRAANTSQYNAVSNTANLVAVHISNEDVYEDSYLNNDNGNKYGPFAARYVGKLGNSLQVSVCSGSNNFLSWTYKNLFSSAPNTSPYAAAVGGANDEIHIVVIDTKGSFTGTANTVLEIYPFLSKASDATNNGESNYYKQVIFNNSKYIYVMDPVDHANTSSGTFVDDWDQPAANISFAITTNQFVTLVGGTDLAPADGDLTLGWDLFKNKETVDISLVLTGDANITVQQHVIDSIVNSRMDCVAFISPPKANVVNTTNESTKITNWLTSLSRSSSYVVADSGWKYQFDKYNNTYRWIPLNADIAGLCVYTDTIRDPWFSPAGFNRGAIKNCIKLAWNPSKTYRDVLYAAGVNPVVSFPGQGTVLFGDKTLQSKPSAFDRIN